MPKIDKNDGIEKVATPERWPGMDSVFCLINVASQREKQLRRGSLPRVALDSIKQRHTYTAVEEVRQGKVSFRRINTNTAKAGDPALTLVE